MSLMNEIRKSFGQQVAIEARFLLVGENFLEDIGLDVDFRYDTENPKEWGVLDFRQNSFNLAAPSNTGITGSLVSPIAGDFGVLSSMGIIGGYGNILTDLQVNFLVRATQAHRDSKALTAPKVTVLSGESATLQVLRFQRYPYEIELDIEDIGDQGDFRWNVEYEEGTIVSGSLLNITPTIMHDKKHVLLNIVSQLTEFLGFQRFDIELPILGAGVPTVGENIYTVELPETEISRVQTRVSVPDGGTLLLGGQKLTAETEVEAGVPVLSKIPILGRLFTNRSTVKDSKVLLILVKPTIILQEETEAKAIAAMEGAF
ncbi:MAG: type II secretion system protein GspD [Planctomycetota bacterium]|jgi:type II secretory pathway component GspD/PulD (secretin)